MVFNVLFIHQIILWLNTNSPTIDRCVDLCHGSCASMCTLYRTPFTRFRSIFVEFFTPATIHSLMCEECTQPELVPWIIEQSLTMMIPDYSQHLAPCFKAVEVRVIDFMRKNRSFLATKALCILLLKYFYCIPREQFTSTFCNELLRSASYFNPAEGPNLLFFIEDVHNIGKLFKHIWEYSDDIVIKASLHTLFNLLSNEEDGKDKSPSFCLGAFVKHLPIAYMETSLKHLISDPKISSDTLSLTVRRMCKWTNFPGSQGCERWIICFLNTLVTNGKVSIVKNTIETQIDDVSRFPPDYPVVVFIFLY